MTLRLKIQAALLSIFTIGMLALTPVAFAGVTIEGSIGDPDAAQGDVTEDDCASLDESLAGAAGCDTSDKIIDFTEYSGTLEGPDASGYDDALTQSKDAREFIQTVVNFALSFLGLVATVIIIYGGIMYVMSRGDEEMATKGKKSIGYAAMGIIIILASFALVNTLIGAGGGGTSTSDLATTGSGTTISDAGAAFDVDGVLDEIEAVTEEYVEAYETLLYVNQEVAFLQSIEMPYVLTVEEWDYTLGGAIEAGWEMLTQQDNDYADQYTLIDEQDIENYIDDIREGITDIQQGVSSFSDTYEESQALYNYLRSGTTSPFSLMEWLDENLQPATAHADGEDYCPNLSSGSASQWDITGLGATVWDTELNTIDDNICGLLGNIANAAGRDYEEAVDDLIERMEDLEDLFDTEDSARLQASGSSLRSLTTLFGQTIDQLELAKSTVGNNTLRELLEQLSDIYTYVQGIQFVDVELTASTLEGNAPMVVRFDVLGTEDPSGETVQDSQIQWDVGNGIYTKSDFSTTEMEADINGETATVKYNEVGTYRVKVKVSSSDADIAAGVVILTVVVEPPRSIIVLDALPTNGDATTLADFREFPAIDKDTYKVTLAEAEGGIVFDASDTLDGDGEEPFYVEWDFGDSEIVSGTWENYKTTDPHYYNEGSYDVSLTVTDATGVEDRKYFKLYVASPAARISHSPESAFVDEIFTFDGTGSSTDVGTIVSYNWTVTSEADANFEYEGETTGSSISTSFDRPGVYTVSLEVGDSSGNTDSTSVDVLVDSQTPVPLFTYEVPNSNQPATYSFDAEDSYDPDEADSITYEWSFEGEEGDQYDIIEGTTTGQEIIVQFYEVDDYDVTLTVMDDHEDPEIQKSDSLTEEIIVTSVLDVELDIDGDNARHLDGNGQELVEFYAESGTANGFEIDYGDGETDFTETVTRGESIFSHTYESAGVFYVTLTAYDDEDNTNSITRRLYIGAGDAPIAVIDVGADDEDVGFGDTVTGNVNTKFSFDASGSVNTDGSSSNLKYSWNFGDGVTSSQKSVTHSFDEHATYTVTLIVKDADDATVSDETTVLVVIEGLDPEIRGLSIVPDADSLETPLKVNINVDAIDEDGKVAYVKGYYYDVDDSAEELGTVIAQGTSFSITVNTKGEEGESKEYGFVVEVTDDDNNTVSSLDELGSPPTLEVVNGPNDSPVAAFSVDRTSIFIGESIVLSSTSYDPDGDIVSYTWDLEGDGFFNDESQEYSSYEWTPTQVGTYEVALKVEDDAGATNTSEGISIYVDAIFEDPVAKFLADIEGTTVVFRDNSEFDEEEGQEGLGWYWDIDLATDSDGDGVSDNDFDYFDQEFSHTYDELGTYQVQLTVVDNAGQTDSVTQDVQVIDADAPVAQFDYEVDEKTVSFKNHSTVDEAQGVEVRSYEWIFDLDNSEDPDEQVDSSKKNPSWEYDDYGDYEVRLIIEDSLGKTDEVVMTVEVPDPIQPVEAVLTSVPQPNGVGQILIDEEEADITFYYGAEGGSGKFTYEIDKNIFYDTSGDGLRDNDVDFEDDQSGSWKTPFYESYGQIVVKLTVTDNETGDSDVATVQVVFQGSLGAANLLNVTPNQMIFLLVSAFLTAVLGAVLAFNSGHSKHNITRR